MRVGQNPNRAAKADCLKPVVLAVVTHLPHFQGYHEKRLEVLQTCLTSMTRNANLPHSVAIWDNNSHPLVREWIREEIKPSIFVESTNLGKTGGRTALMRILPPKTIVAYSDDDMYFYPDWLRPQIEVLEHFPNVACVTGYPVRTQFRWGNEQTVEWAKQYAILECGRFIPDKWEDDFAVSVGRDPVWHREYTRNDVDFLVTYQGKRAYATSHHCQFIARQEIVSRIVSWDGAAMGDERVFDTTLDMLGLRLATIQRYTRHIGNVLHDELRREIESAQGAKE